MLSPAKISGAASLNPRNSGAPSLSRIAFVITAQQVRKSLAVTRQPWDLKHRLTAPAPQNRSTNPTGPGSPAVSSLICV